MAQQLALDLLGGYPATLDNFVAGANAEALAQARRLAAGQSTVGITYFWGPPGSGKTHLLAGIDGAARQAGLQVHRHNSDSLVELDSEQAVRGSSVVHLVDDVEALGEAARAGLFALINIGRLSPAIAIVVTGQVSPMALPLKDELRSRLSWGLVYGLFPLDDNDKAIALAGLAKERGVTISGDLIPYLLAHTSRDMRALIGLFDTLDRYALARNRAITVPLLREYLQMNLH